MPTNRVDLIPGRQDEISNNAPADFSGNTDPREFRALRLGDRWSPEADVTLGATTIKADMHYRLIANPGKLAGAATETDLQDWQNMQDYLALINIPPLLPHLLPTHPDWPDAVIALFPPTIWQIRHWQAGAVADATAYYSRTWRGPTWTTEEFFARIWNTGSITGDTVVKLKKNATVIATATILNTGNPGWAKVRVGWDWTDPQGNPDSFKVEYRNVTDSGAWTTASGGSALAGTTRSFDVTKSGNSLLDLKTYEMRVTATNEAGTGTAGVSNQVSTPDSTGTPLNNMVAVDAVTSWANNDEIYFEVTTAGGAIDVEFNLR